MLRRGANHPDRGAARPAAAGKTSCGKLRRVVSLAALAIFALLIAHPAGIRPARAQSPDWQGDGQPVRHVTVIVNKSRTFQLGQPFSTAVVGAPDIADALPMSDRTLYIQGKKVGTTNVSIFDTSNKLMGVLDVEVAIDTQSLQNKIRLGTGTNSIHVSSSNGEVILTGTAPNAVVGDRAVSIVQSVAPNGVINAMSIAPSQQVLLKVRFLEATRDAGQQLGVNWYGANTAGTRGFSSGLGQVTATNGATTTAGGASTATTTTFPVLQPLFQAAGTLTGTAAAPFGVVLAQMVNGGTSIDALVTALETQGLVRRLAEPNLMALSGDTAQFLAGGEFPVPIAATSASGIVTPTIEFKPFGVQLSFTPTVLQDGIINLRVAPEVSELDFSNAVTISGTTIPSLIKRDAVTTVELRDGQSFAIAGLLLANNTRNRSQIPWLGSVPVLGALFSSNSYQKDETDLIIIVTPHLVEPVGPEEHLATPLDKRLPSNDVDFFLNGKMEVPNRYSDYVTTGGDVVGPYGHIIRVEPASDAPVVK
jgi:pilus assembly protein CpaC